MSQRSFPTCIMEVRLYTTCAVLVLLWIVKLHFISAAYFFNKQLETEDQTMRNTGTPIGYLQERSHISIAQMESPCTTSVTEAEVLVNCSYRHLTEIKRSWFHENTTTLLLNNNQLDTIPGRIFSNLKRLKNLTLSNNEIEMLFNDSFAGLDELSVLNLENNHLNRSATYPFSFLSSLVELHLIHQRSNDIIDYVLPHSLTYLSFDFNNEALEFSPEYKKITNLTTLIVSGSLTNISDHSFQHVKHLKELTLIELNNLEYLDPKVLQHFYDLDVLILKDTPIGLRKSFALFSYLNSTKMSQIRFDGLALNINKPDVSVMRNESVLTQEMTYYVRQICLSHFSLQSNYIILIGLNSLFSKPWQQCLKSLDLTDNPILGIRSACFQFVLLKNLEVLILESFFSRDQYFRNFWEDHVNETDDDLSRESPVSYLTQDNIRQSIDVKNEMEETNQDVTSDSSILCPTCGLVRVYANPFLKALHVQKITPSALFQVNYYIENGANITYIDFSINGFREFNYIIKGLTGIKTIIASGNNMNSLLVNFFDSLNTVEKLALSACNLVPSFVSQNSRRLFQYLPALQWLALSSNQLEILAPNTFVDNLNLKGLNLAYNRFRSIPFEIQITPKLYVLDMRGNALTTIDASTRSELDTRSHTSAGFYLYLDGNTLSCACENLDFLMWLSSTHVILDNNRNYTCIDNSGKLTTTLEYKDVEKLWRECSGQYFFYLSIVCFSTLCIGYLLVFIINHNLTYIMSYVLQYFGNFRLHDCKDYKNGVYIGYADNDYAFACHQLLPYIEDKLGLRTFVRDRDLLPSSDVASGIVDAINASWRVVLVFSENFLRADEWMWFTIRCAVYSQTPANPARVVVLVHRRHVHQLPTELLSAVTDDSVIAVTRWEMDYVIQQKLKTLLGQ